ncbi:MAG: hypothetical protein ACOCZ9_04270 [Spirochaetota bacterium]
MSDVPEFLNDAFRSLLEEITEVARREGGAAGRPVKKLDSSSSEYFSEFVRLAGRRSVSRVVLLSDSFSEQFPDNRFLSTIDSRLFDDPDFEFYAFVGLLADEHTNEFLKSLRQRAENASGYVEVRELGMKPLMRGLFTDRGAVCQALQLPGSRIEESYYFGDIDLTEKVLSVTRAYLEGTPAQDFDANSEGDARP